MNDKKKEMKFRGGYSAPIGIGPRPIPPSTGSGVKPDVSVYHLVMGRSVKKGATDTCSKCGHTIPEEHVPLMLWNDRGELMWVYCEDCDAYMFKLLRRET